MADKKGSKTPKFLRHRALVGAEAVLLVGVGQQLLNRQIDAVRMPNPARVLFTMACTLGVLGGLVLLARALATKGVAQTHQVAKALPIPAGTWLLHIAAFAGLFVLYAIVWHLPVEVPMVGMIGEAAKP
jgi:hypothetical protein